MKHLLTTLIYFISVYFILKYNYNRPENKTSCAQVLLYSACFRHLDCLTLNKLKWYKTQFILCVFFSVYFRFEFQDSCCQFVMVEISINCGFFGIFAIRSWLFHNLLTQPVDNVGNSLRLRQPQPIFRAITKGDASQLVSFKPNRQSYCHQAWIL